MSRPAPPGLRAVGIFLLFAAVMASLAGVTLIWRHAPLTRMWRLNPRAYTVLAPLGAAAGVPFLILGMCLAAAAVLWLRHRVWGWRLAVVIVALQTLGDLVNMFLGRVIEGGAGVAIAGALLGYLLWTPVRAAFRRPPS